MCYREHPSYSEIVLSVGKGNSQIVAVLPINSTRDSDSAGKLLWKWINPGNPKDVQTDPIMIAQANSSVDDHNDSTLKKLPGDPRYTFSRYTESHRESLACKLVRRKIACVF